jgi:restriction system protein
MSHTAFNLAAILLAYWPAALAVVSLLLLRGRGRWKGRLQRIRRGLLVTWTVLLAVWLVLWIEGQAIAFWLPEPLNSLLFFVGILMIASIEIYPWLKNLQLSRDSLHQVIAVEELTAMTPRQFEEFTAATYRALGYKVKHVGQSGDHGVDLILRTPLGRKWVVQCKRWREPVGEATVRELYGTLHHEGAERAILVTSAEITPPAEAWARGKPIDLVDGAAFLALVERACREKQNSPVTRWLQWAQSGFRPIPPPVCPRCRGKMLPHPRIGANRAGRRAYRCQNYPTCRTVIVRKG